MAHRKCLVTLYMLFVMAWVSACHALPFKEDLVKIMVVEEESVFLKTEEKGHFTVQDSGHVTNCGSVPVNVTWTPKVVSVSGSLNFAVDYTVPCDVQSFIVNASVAYHGEPPFINYPNVPLSCKDIGKSVPCPIKKGTRFNGTYPFKHMDDLRAYQGIFDLFLEATNEKKEQLMCLKMTVKITE